MLLGVGKYWRSRVFCEYAPNISSESSESDYDEEMQFDEDPSDDSLLNYAPPFPLLMLGSYLLLSSSVCIPFMGQF